MGSDTWQQVKAAGGEKPNKLLMRKSSSSDTKCEIFLANSTSFSELGQNTTTLGVREGTAGTCGAKG